MENKYNHHIHHRRSVRLRGYDYSHPGAYFVTVCAYNRECLFGEISGGMITMNDAGGMVQKVWNELPARFPGIELDAFVIMPNHIHGIINIDDCHGSIENVGAGSSRPAGIEDSQTISPGGATLKKNRGGATPPLQRKTTLGQIIGYLKYQSTKRINEYRQSPGVPLWQRNYYEHIIRNEHDLNDIRDYIAQNPLRWREDEENPDRNS